MRTSLAPACAALLAVSCSGTGPASPRPTAMEPASGIAALPVRVVIRGDGFLARPSEEQSGGGTAIDSRHRAWVGDTELVDVAWIDVRTLEATVPAGLPTGLKRLVVENAFGRRGALDAAYEVIATPTATLKATLDATPPIVNVGQPATVTLTILDVGGAAVRDVVPDALSLGGDAASGAAVNGPVPASVERLEPGGAASFTWSVIAAAPGTLSLSSRVLALDDLSSTQVSSQTGVTSAGVQVPAQLTATVAASRATADVGQAVAVTLTIANGGGARAALTAVSPTVAGPAATCSAVDPAMPQSVSGGETLQVTWTCTASEPGALALGAAVAGVDGTSGAALSATASPAAVTVQTPAVLAAAIAVQGNPTTVLVGTTLAITLTVQDNGQAAASVTRVDPVVTPASAATCGAPSPAPPRDVSGLGTTTFSWSCTALVAGSVTLGASVGGVDANTGAPLQAAAPGVTLSAQLPATLTATIAASGSTANVGQAVIATFTLFNGGTATANISAVTRSVSGTATATCGAVSPSAATIPGGGSATFTWTCTASVHGTLVLSGTASGTDVVSGAPLSATPATPASVIVQNPAVLGVASFVSSRSVAVTGQATTLTLVLANSGEAAADLLAIAPSVTPSATASCTAATPAPPQIIAGGTSLQLTWSCTATAAGSYTLGATVSAVDANTGQLLAPAVTALPLTVQTPAALTVSGFTASRATADTGQAVAVTLTLVNGGGTAATVTVVTPSLSPSASPGCTAASPAPPQSLAAGGTLTFTWTCTASTAGSYQLGAAISGVAGLTNAPLSASAGPLALTVQSPASLSSTLAVGGADPLVLGQAAPVTLTVTNLGGATANLSAVTPSATGTATASCTAPTPAPPQSVAGGTSLAFTWSCTPTSLGALTLGGSASGSDANTGAAVQTTAPGVTRTVVSGTTLSVTTFAASRATADVGQQVAVTLTIANTGVDAGDIASVTPTVTPAATATCTAPSPAPPLSIPAGNSVTFGWTCTATSAGGYTLGVTISATDAAGQAVPLAPNPIPLTVQTPALLAPATLQASRATADVGQAITVTVVLSNLGGAGARVTSVTPAASGSGAATCGAPSPAPPQIIAGGATATFTWTCTGTAAGAVTLSSAVSAADVNTGADVSPAITAVGVTVQTPAALTATLTSSAPSVPAGTPVGLTLALLNTGQAAAHVTAVTGTITPSGNASCTAASPAPPQDVAGGTTTTFTWTCKGGNVRTYTLGATVAATDANTGAALVVTIPNVNLQTTSASPAPAPATTGGEVILVAVDPLGDGTAEPVLGASGDAVWVGPGRDGETLAWIDPGGSTALMLPAREPGLVGAALTMAGGATAAAITIDEGAGPAAAPGVSALATIEGIVYAADAGGIARSTAPLDAGLVGWVDVTPVNPSWRARASVSVAPGPPSARWASRHRAVPSIVAFGGCGEGPCVLAARNVAGDAGEPPVAPQLWRCEPRAVPGACDAADWSLAAPDPTGALTRLGEPSGEALTVLAATPRWLYVGLDDRTTGVRLYRAAAVPRTAADLRGRAGCAAGTPRCEGLGGNAFGDRHVTRLLDAKVLTVRGVTSLWIVAGDGVGPARVYRVDD